jgi:hypothetical protein
MEMDAVKMLSMHITYDEDVDDNGKRERETKKAKRQLYICR